MCLERYAKNRLEKSPKIGKKNQKKLRGAKLQYNIYDLLKKSIKIPFFILLVSSRWSCLLNEPKSASIFCAIGSFKSLVYFSMVDTHDMLEEAQQDHYCYNL